MIGLVIGELRRRWLEFLLGAAAIAVVIAARRAPVRELQEG